MADGKVIGFEKLFGIEPKTEIYAKQTQAGYVIISDEDGNSVTIRYYFDGDKLILNGTAYKRKN